MTGWYTLPQPRSYYVYDRNGDGLEDSDSGRLLDDCAGAADADVFFPEFFGLNLMFSADLSCDGGTCSFGGSSTFTRDGQTRPPLLTDPAGDGPFDASGKYVPGSDFVNISVTNDSINVYVLLEFAGAFSGGIALYLDTDQNTGTGCNGGHEYLIFVTSSEPGGHLALADYRNCQVQNSFPGAVTSAQSGKFLEFSVPVQTLRTLTPNMTGFRIKGGAGAPPSSGVNDEIGPGPYPLNPRGFSATVDFTTYGSTVLVDAVQLVIKYLKDVGIDAKLNTLEYGAYISRVLSGKHDSMGFGPYTPFLDPDGFLFFRYYPGESRNTSMVNDPVVADMLLRQRRTLDPVKRREIIFDIQRYLAKQQYYVQLASAVNVAVWDRALRNYGPNLGFDWGGRLTAAWLDR